MPYNLFKSQTLNCSDLCVIRVFKATGKLKWIMRTVDKDTIERGFIEFLAH